MKNKTVIALGAALVGILFLGVAVLYFVEPAKMLPSFFPGFDITELKHHYKHGIGALFLALGCFAIAWFQTGKKTSTTAATTQK